MENNKFSVYSDWNCKLKSGEGIKLERTIYCNENNIQEDLEIALNSDYENELVKLQEEELKIFEDLKKKLDDWQVVAEKVRILELAEKYNKSCKGREDLETTNNEWVNTKEGCYDEFRISNKSYRMWIRVYEDTKYQNGVHTPYKWEVSYCLSTNGGSDYNTCNVVASIDRKSFTDKDKAYKYIEGRKKFFSNYFQELYQPIREEDAMYFKTCGKLLKGFRIKE